MRWFLKHLSACSRWCARSLGRVAPAGTARQITSGRFYDLSQDVLCTASFDGYVRQVNSACTSVLGWSPQEVCDRPFTDFIHPDDRATVMSEVAKVMQGIATGELDLRLLCKDGGYKWLSFLGFSVPEEGLMYGMARDLTQRRQAEAALQESEGRLRAILEAAADAIITVNEAGEVESFNPAAERMFGYSANEAVGKSISVLMPGRFANGHDSFLAHARDRGESQTGPREVTGQRKDGSRFPIELSVSAADLGGRHVYTGILRDISERKRAEAELREYMRIADDTRKRLEQQARELENNSQQLQSVRNQAEMASNSKSEFLANMSHEIRTPLTAILGFAEVLLGSVTTSEAVSAADTIKRNGEYLLSILNDILDLSRIEAGKIHIETMSVSPAQVVAEVVSLMRVRADAKGLYINVVYDGPVPETIETDPTRFRQILINLVGNAVKFTEVGGVQIRVGLLAPVGVEPKLAVTVVDTGIGMSREQRERLFRPFTQADASTTRRFGGTGLGLTISKRLAESLGGTLAVETASGHGSTFTFTIDTGSLQNVARLHSPVEAEATAELRFQEAPSIQLSGRVLLAEDGPDNQRLISFLLKKAGAHVNVADNGEAAVSRALHALSENRPFDVILMDMQMPVLDGYAATRRLRDKGYTRPIIALTAHAMNGDREKCLAAGCDDFAPKPIDRKTLLTLVQSYMNRTAQPSDLQPSDLQPA